MGLLFYPRGGSAYVVRYLSPALEPGGVVGVARGRIARRRRATRRTRRPSSTASTCTSSTTPTPCAPSTPVATPIAAPQPMHPSYEDRAGVPDVVFASVPPELADHLAGGVGAAAARRRRRPTPTCSTSTTSRPQLDAVHRHWPDVPLVVHLHGTELKLIDGDRRRASRSRAALGETLATMPGRRRRPRGGRRRRSTPTQRELLRTTRWDAWRHGEFWAAHLREQAQLADHVITVSPQNRDTAISLLGVDPEHVTAIPNGVDIERFHPRPRAARRPARGLPARARRRSAGLDRDRAAGRRSPTPTRTSTGCSVPTTTRPCCSSSVGSSASSACPR